jgi:hypothetical protein
VDLGDDVDAASASLLPFGHPQRHVQRRRFSVVLMTSPRNIAAIRSPRPRASARATRRRIVSSVMRFFE